MAPNFAEGFRKAGALGASGVQSQGLLGAEPEKLRSGSTRAQQRGRGSKSPAPTSPSPGQVGPWDCQTLLTTVGLCPKETQGFTGPPSPPLRRRLHSSWAQLRLTGSAPWGRGDPAPYIAPLRAQPDPSRPFRRVHKPLLSPFSIPAGP